MRYLGIDYGKKRMGLALSDESGKLAFPLTRLLVVGFRQAAKEIAGIIRKEGAEKIIIGLPITFDGRESPQAKETREFGQKLEKELKLKVEFENEVLSTKLAQRSGVPADKIDAASAAIILQSYLDKKNSKS